MISIIKSHFKKVELLNLKSNGRVFTVLEQLQQKHDPHMFSSELLGSQKSLDNRNVRDCVLYWSKSEMKSGAVLLRDLNLED